MRRFAYLCAVLTAISLPSACSPDAEAAVGTICTKGRPCVMRIMDGDGSAFVDVNAANGQLQVSQVQGTSSRATYIASTFTSVTALDSLLNIESSDTLGFIVKQVCIGPGTATASASTNVQLIRRTTASTLGSAVSAEVTAGSNSLAKMDPSDSNWAGIVRVGGTEGTAGAILDSFSVHVGQTGAANGIPAGMICKDYCDNAYTKCPIVASGVANGLSVMFTGTAGGTGQSASVTFVAN